MPKQNWTNSEEEEVKRRTFQILKIKFIAISKFKINLKQWHLNNEIPIS